jgi:hypothetical protein
VRSPQTRTAAAAQVRGRGVAGGDAEAHAARRARAGPRPGWGGGGRRVQRAARRAAQLPPRLRELAQGRPRQRRAPPPTAGSAPAPPRREFVVPEPRRARRQRARPVVLVAAAVEEPPRAARLGLRHGRGAGAAAEGGQAADRGTRAGRRGRQEALCEAGQPREAGGEHAAAPTPAAAAAAAAASLTAAGSGSGSGQGLARVAAAGSPICVKVVAIASAAAVQVVAVAAAAAAAAHRPQLAQLRDRPRQRNLRQGVAESAREGSARAVHNEFAVQVQGVRDTHLRHQRVVALEGERVGVQTACLQAQAAAAVAVDGCLVGQWAGAEALSFRRRRLPHSHLQAPLPGRRPPPPATGVKGTNAPAAAADGAPRPTCTPGGLRTPPAPGGSGGVPVLAPACFCFCFCF